MKWKKKIRLCIVFALIVSVVSGTVSFAAECGQIRQKVLRLHVIAASDSARDQAIKYKVRDALLQAGAQVFDGSVTAQNAAEKLTPALPELQKIALRTVRQNGSDAPVSVTLQQDLFPTKTYGGVTLPAGTYLALKVVIGSGSGHNWWCVMFPALCLPAARANTDVEAVLGADGAALVRRSPRYEPRFKIVELWERVKAAHGRAPEGENGK